MNIFFLHLSPRLCALFHADKHVVKMILETTQLLCTAWHMADPEHAIYKPCYRKTHYNHPSAKWARESRTNYRWLCALGLALCREYSYRYRNRTHKCEAYLRDLAAHVPPVPDAGFTAPRQAMPDEFKGPDAIAAYRAYYTHAKQHLHSWKGRSRPRWLRTPVPTRAS